jgi:acetyltransferase-like isoleucine patch superfamily enzyme
MATDSSIGDDSRRGHLTANVAEKSKLSPPLLMREGLCSRQRSGGRGGCGSGADRVDAMLGRVSGLGWQLIAFRLRSMSRDDPRPSFIDASTRRSRRWLARGLGRLELMTVLGLGRTVGLGAIVRYLRNPEPALVAPILRAFGASVGPRTRFKGALHIDNAEGDLSSAGDFSHLRIGSNCFIGEAVYFDLANVIEIEDDAVLAARAAVITHSDCNRARELAAHFPRVCKPVRIGRSSWVGFGATVLAGVVVAPRSVVAAGALCSQSTEEGFVFAGIPARRVRRVEERAHPKARGERGG